LLWQITVTVAADLAISPVPSGANMIKFLCGPGTGKRWPIGNAIVVAMLVVAGVAAAADPVAAVAQEMRPEIPESGPEPVAQTPGDTASSEETDAVSFREKGLNLWELLQRGGWFMLPLGLLSLVVVALSIERTLALRREKILPAKLVRELGNLSRDEEGFDPRSAFRLCQRYPSAASRVLRVMLLKAGRPQSEVEYAVSEASQREAARLQGVVSWLTLAAAVAPLIGLLGTVWGMIQAFYDTTQLLPGQNKAEVLAQGIYTALVTTLSGLVIAIPSAVLAHWFDQRIVGWFHKIEELAASLTPLMESFEGRLRTTAGSNDWSANDHTAGPASASAASAQAADVVPPPSPR
jgi:biopolymer transport protein ExbB